MAVAIGLHLYVWARTAAKPSVVTVKAAKPTESREPSEQFEGELCPICLETLEVRDECRLKTSDKPQRFVSLEHVRTLDKNLG